MGEVYPGDPLIKKPDWKSTNVDTLSGGPLYTPQDLLELRREAHPFQLEVVKQSSLSGCHYDVSIKHADYGYTKRSLSEASFTTAVVMEAISRMKKELGYPKEKPKEKVVPIVPVKQAQSQHHTCGRHGNQLVAAQNRETGEEALRCPVDGCTTILRKRRKSILSG